MFLQLQKCAKIFNHSITSKNISSPDFPDMTSIALIINIIVFINII